MKFTKYAQQFQLELNFLQRLIGKFFMKWKWLWRNTKEVGSLKYITTDGYETYDMHGTVYQEKEHRFLNQTILEVEKECDLIGNC